jgi:hypothetical protein
MEAEALELEGLVKVSHGCLRQTDIRRPIGRLNHFIGDVNARVIWK